SKRVLALWHADLENNGNMEATLKSKSVQTGEIKFNQVDFSYREHCSIADYEQCLFSAKDKNGEQNIQDEQKKLVPQLTLSNFTYTVPQGTTVAIVGESGSGKSTL